MRRTQSWHRARSLTSFTGLRANDRFTPLEGNKMKTLVVIGGFGITIGGAFLIMVGTAITSIAATCDSS